MKIANHYSLFIFLILSLNTFASGNVPPKVDHPFTGTIEGTLACAFEDNTIALFDLKVELISDGQSIGSTFTDMQGEYRIAVDFSHPEDNLTFFYRVSAINSDGSVRAITDFGDANSLMTLNTIQSARIDWTSGVSPNVPDTIFASPEYRFQLVHWVNHAKLFLEETGVSNTVPDLMTEELHIRHSVFDTVTNFFMPAGMKASAIGRAVATGLMGPFTQPAVISSKLSDKNCLYISRDDLNNSGTIYHEFGHHLMWHLQNRAWLGLAEAGLANHYRNANSKTMALAWTEGFANGIGRILWANMRWEFGELLGPSDDPRNPIHIDFQVVRKQVPIIREQTLEHGFLAESYVGNFIYDLWDGETNLLLGRNTGVVGRGMHADDGLINSTYRDTIEVSFATICSLLSEKSYAGPESRPAPERFGQNSFLINNFPEFFQDLVATTNNPLERQSYKRLSEINMLHNLLPGAQNNQALEINELDSDSLFYIGSFRHKVWIGKTWRLNNRAGHEPSLPSTVQDVFWFKQKNLNTPGDLRTEDDVRMDVVQLPNLDDSYNFGSIKVFGQHTLTDSLMIGGEGNEVRLMINEHKVIGWQDPNNNFFMPPGTVLANKGSQFNVDVVGDMLLEVANGGILSLGDSLEQSIAEVRIKEGATFNLGSGTGRSQLIINDNSKLIIERNASFNVFAGADIYLNGDNAVLQIEGDWFIDTNVTFTFSGRGHVHLNLPNRVAENITMGPNSSIELRGRDKIEDLILYVEHNSELQLPLDCQYNFSLEKGLVQLGASSMIDVRRARLNLDSIKVDAIDKSIGLHQGILFLGNEHLIRSCDFHNGLIGIHASFGAGTCLSTGLTMSDIYAANNTVAVQCTRAGINLTGSIFEFNSVGILQIDPSADSEISGSTALLNSTFYRSWQNVPVLNQSLVEINACKIESGDTAIVINTPTRLSMACDSIFKYTTIAFLGIDSQLEIGSAKRNVFDSFEDCFVLNESRNLRLINGRNNFNSVNGNFFAGSVQLDSAVDGFSPSALNANSNYWGIVNFLPSNRVQLTDQFGQPVTLQGNILSRFSFCGN